MAEFQPENWGQEQYAKAKSLVDTGNFADPARGEQLRSAVQRYEKWESEALPTQSIEGDVPEPVTPTTGMAAGPGAMQAGANLLKLPERAWEGFKESAGDALTSLSDSAYFGHGGEISGKLYEARGFGDAPTGERLYDEEVERAKERSPVGAAVGGFAPLAGYGYATSALNPAVIGGVMGGLEAHGRSALEGLSTIPETLMGTGTGALIGKAASKIPEAAEWVAGKASKAKDSLGGLADELWARSRGAPNNEALKGLKKSGKLADIAKTGREIIKSGPMSSMRGHEEAAEEAANLYEQKGDAIVGALGGDDMLIPPDALQSRVRGLKGGFAEGGYAGQPMRDELENIASSYDNMRQVEKPFAYHTTPSENLEGIAREGLLPAQGGKNYDLKKNRGTTYFAQGTPETPADEAMRGWTEKISDVGGGKPMSMLRTTADVQPVAGANAGIKIRTDAVEPLQLEYLDTQTGRWKPLSQYGKPEPTGKPLTADPRAPDWFDEEQSLLALAQDASPTTTGGGASQLAKAQPSAAAGGLAPDGMLHGEVQPRGLPSGEDALGFPNRPEVFGRAGDVDRPAFGAQNGIEPARPEVYARATDWDRPALGAGTPSPLAREQGSAMTGGPNGLDPSILTADVVPNSRRGIPLGEVLKERTAFGKKTTFGSDSPVQQLREDVYSAMNRGIRSEADRAMPGSGEALRNANWNQHVAMTVRDWSSGRALQETFNRQISPSDYMAAGFGGIAGAATGNPAAMAAGAAAANRLVRGREHAVLELGARGASGLAGGVADKAASFGQAVDDWAGAPIAARAGGQLAGRGGGAMTGAFAQDNESADAKRVGDNGHGQHMGAALQQILQTNPEALGAYRRQLEAAVGDPAKLSATLEKLERDPLFRKNVRPALMQATGSK